MIGQRCLSDVLVMSYGGREMRRGRTLRVGDDAKRLWDALKGYWIRDAMLMDKGEVTTLRT